MEQELLFRGVPFTVQSYGQGYLWVVHPSKEAPAGTACGETTGRGAFRRAVTQAHHAIDQWLALNPSGES